MQLDYTKWLRKISRIFVITTVLTLFPAGAPAQIPSATNVIIMIGDGMGHEHVKAGAWFKGSPLCFQSWPDTADVNTDSASAPVITDSAATATEMATGVRVYKGVISKRAPGDNAELQTILEYLKAKGKRTGLVTSSFITHATPAAFGAHELSRTAYTAIAADYLNQSRPNVLLGGGANGMSPTSAQNAGYTVVTDRAQMQAVDTATETMLSGQFGNSYMPYETNVNSYLTLPHLSEMATVALDILSRSTNGFFLMIEGGRIDHAGHDRLQTNMVYEMIEFDRTISNVFAWVTNRTDTLLIVTADHETGGLTALTNNGAGTVPTVSWSTTNGHTATDIGLWAWGPGAHMVTSNMTHADTYNLMRNSYFEKNTRAGAVTVHSDRIESEWTVRAGDSYSLQSTTNLIDANWIAISTVTAQAASISIVDTNPVENQVFYRLIPEK